MSYLIKIFLTLVFLTNLISCNNESPGTCAFSEYDKYQRKGMLKYVDAAYKESLDNFERAFKVKNDESENDYFYAAAAALRLGQYSKADKFIKDAIVLKNANKSYFENFEEFNSYRKIDELILIHENYGIYQNEYLENSISPDLNAEMDILIELDQKVRTGTYSTEEMIKQDSLNVKKLIKITKEYGWQDKSWLILWHQRGTHDQDIYPWNYFRPLIDSLINECQIRPDYWARYEDERLMFSEGYQKYGTYWSNYDSYPVKDIESIDSLREEIGMPPLWYLNKVYNSNLPDGYHPFD